MRTARLQRENYALQLDNAKKVLYKEIQQAWYNAAAAEAQYTSSHTATTASETSFRLMSEKYENGKANAVEYNEAKQNLMKAQSDSNSFNDSFMSTGTDQIMVNGGITSKPHAGYKEGRRIVLKDKDIDKLLKENPDHVSTVSSTLRNDSALNHMWD